MGKTDFDPIETFNHIHLLDTADKVAPFMEWVQSPRGYVGVDTETSGLDWFDGELRLVQFGDRDSGWAVPFDMWKGLCAWAMRQFEDTGTDLILHNAKFDLHWLDRHAGWSPSDWGLIHDTGVIANLVDFGVGKGLKELSVHYVHSIADIGQKMLKDDMKRGKWGWDTVPITLPSYWAYGVMDTILTVRLFEKLYPKIFQLGMVEAYDVEQAVVEPLFYIERRGMLVDAEWCGDHISKIEQRMASMEQQALESYGLESMGSGDQIARAFMNSGVEMIAKTKTGKWKTDRDTLEEIAHRTKHPLAEMVNEHRKLGKMSSSYYANFLKFQRSDGRVHPSYRQMQARTHRMSATMPAMQTIPRPGTDPDVRNSFVAPEGKVVMACDLANIEARLFAHVANDPAMIAAIRSGVDLHCNTAERIYHLDKCEKEDPRRQVAKNSLFTTIYGGGAGKLAITAGIPVQEAVEALQGLHGAYPSIKAFQQSTIDTAKRALAATGRAYITLSDGRQLSMGSNDDRFYAFANWTIQGEAATVMKRCLNNAVAMGLGDVMVGCIHDEIVLELDESDVPEVSRIVEDAMCDDFNYSVPIEAECGAPAYRLGDAK